MIRFLTYHPVSQTVRHGLHFLRQSALSVSLLVLVVYLAFHAVQGERGLIAFQGLKEANQQRQNALSDIRAENAELRQKIDLLSGASPDIDFLEERVRTVLGFAYVDEKILILPSEKKRQN